MDTCHVIYIFLWNNKVDLLFVQIFFTVFSSCFISFVSEGRDIVLRIIIEYSSFKGFCPLETKWNYSSSKKIHIHLLTLKKKSSPPQMCTQPQVTKPTKQKMKLFFRKMIMASIIDKIHVIHLKCNNVIEKIQVHMWWQVFLLVWNFSQMWKTYMKKEYLFTFFFENKIIRFEIFENHVATFPYWFWSNIIFFNV